MCSRTDRLDATTGSNNVALHIPSMIKDLWLFSLPQELWFPLWEYMTGLLLHKYIGIKVFASASGIFVFTYTLLLLSVFLRMTRGSILVAESPHR